MGIKKQIVLKIVKLRKEKEARNFLAHTTTAAKWGTSLKTAWNMRSKGQ